MGGVRIGRGRFWASHGLLERADHILLSEGKGIAPIAGVEVSLGLWIERRINKIIFQDFANFTLLLLDCGGSNIAHQIFYFGALVLV